MSNQYKYCGSENLKPKNTPCCEAFKFLNLRLIVQIWVGIDVFIWSLAEFLWLVAAENLVQLSLVNCKFSSETLRFDCLILQ